MNEDLFARTDWTTTYSGYPFFPLAPRPEDVRIADIAHALSNLCRFAGHTRRFYCVTPEMRVLTADLNWRPAGDLVTGDSLIGFDDVAHQPGTAGTLRRRLRPSVATLHGVIRRHVYRLVLSDGTNLRSSSEHPWLCASKVSRNQRWFTTKQIIAALRAGQRRYLLRFLPIWQTDETYEAGYLAGFVDGEGSLSFRSGIHSGKVDGGLTIMLAQNPGGVLQRVVNALTARGFTFRLVKNPCSSVWNLTIKGGWTEQLRLLGSIRPGRLLEKFAGGFEAGQVARQFPSVDAPYVVDAYDEGQQQVVALETSTHTYFSEGFGAHNSVAQHSVIVSRIVEREHALWALLHDASEAYLCDVISPVKRQTGLKGYREIERLVQDAICVRFGLPLNEPTQVKVADTLLLRTEQRDLMAMPDGWHPRETLQMTVVPLNPHDAERAFLIRFHELKGQV